AKRWLYLGGFSLQPSEFLKPAFLVLAAWLFAEGTKRPDVPATLIACLLIVPVVTPLILQPDFGQTLLIAIAWAALFFMAGMPWGWIVLLGGVGIVGSVGAYFTMDHVARRIDRFLDPSSGDTYQVDRAIESFTSGGWFGRGPGEGIVKRALPDSHTDFIFAVAGEEFGAIFCLIVVAIFAAFVVRGLSRSYRASDAFLRLAPAGLCMLIGLQATINMAVNLSLVPAKGMTLPFISYGGSSMLSLAFAGGMILGLTRRRTDPIAVRSAHADRMFAESPAE
ncbi:MAG: putative peptidoglycan glycosyltransferase FtsW, partial [Pseudomonadota bacterium]